MLKLIIFYNGKTPLKICIIILKKDFFGLEIKSNGYGIEMKF